LEVALGLRGCSFDLVVWTVMDEGEPHGLQWEGAPEDAGTNCSVGVRELRK
jgi:hypothetical protein